MAGLTLILGACSSPEQLAVKALTKKHYRLAADDFLLAAANGDISSLDLFQKTGFAVDTTNIHGRTALIEASRNGQFAAVQWLIQAGASTTLSDVRQRDALIAAAGGGHTAIARLLLANGADSALRDTAGWTCLSLAAYKGHAEIVHLLAARSDQNRLNEALLLACFNGDVVTIANLLNQGADINCKSPECLTPLMITAKKGKMEATRFLLSQKANHLMIGTGGKTAALLAKESGFSNIYELILAAEPTEEEKILRAATLLGGNAGNAPGNARKKLVALKGSTIRSLTPQSDALSVFQITEFPEDQSPAEKWAILTASNSQYRYLARTGDTFRTFDSTHGERKYLVVAVNGKEIALQEEKSQQTFRLGRDGPG
jgi:ankyrin repeat protein